MAQKTKLNIFETESVLKMEQGSYAVMEEFLRSLKSWSCHEEFLHVIDNFLLILQDSLLSLLPTLEIVLQNHCILENLSKKFRKLKNNNVVQKRIGMKLNVLLMWSFK